MPGVHILTGEYSRLRRWSLYLCCQFVQFVVKNTCATPANIT